MADDNTKAEDSIRKQFPVLRNPGMPRLVPITDKTLTHTFPEHRFFVARFQQYPVARVAPAPLKAQNLFAVTTEGKVSHLTDTRALEKFFRDVLKPVTDEASAKDSAGAWLHLTEEFKQDGFFEFAIPKESLRPARSDGAWRASGKVVVARGGKGEINASLSFTGTGKLTKVDETSTVQAGVRPICQATKLLDPDPIVRRMAETDILVMGRAVRSYLDEQRAKAPPELQRAIDRIWQRIVDEEW
jgi:hypothetical protein